MNILLIHQAFTAPDQPGGTRHYELGRHLVERGHDFAIVASNLSYLTGQSVGESEGIVTEQRLDGVRVLRTYTYPALHRSFVWRVVSFLSFMVTSVYAGLKAGPVDVVMGTSPPIFQAASACLVAALRRRPFLLEIRDLWPEFAIDMGVLTNPTLIRLSRRLEKFLYRRATHILVNSPAYRDYLIQRGVRRSKISFISNGVDPAMFDPDARGEKLREKWGATDKFVVTYAGAMGMANDLSSVLGAAHLLRDEPEIQFVMVGDGKERGNLEAEAEKLGLPNLKFVGSHPKSEMTEVLAASDACLATLKDIPMFTTTYPNKVFDYMAAARPTILGIDGVIREVIEAAQGGVFVPPGNAGALADAVRELSRDRQRARQMGASAREYVVQHFNRQEQAQQFIALVEKVGRGRKSK